MAEKKKKSEPTQFEHKGSTYSYEPSGYQMFKEGFLDNDTRLTIDEERRRRKLRRQAESE